MMSTLADALFTTTQQNVLGILYAHPERSFYTKEIIRATGMGVATIKRELDRMLDAGIIGMVKVGNQHHYKANINCPIYAELLSIVRKTFGIADEIRSALISVADQIELAFIYGSIAKGEETDKSDIDLLVVSKSLAYADLMVALSQAEKSLGRPVNPSIYTKGELNKKRREKNSFVVRILAQDKIWIIGGEDDIGKIR